jgi:hemerythrin-like metal-binding protein
MSFFDWQPKLALGVDVVDGEHKGLIAAMNEIHDKVERRAGKAELALALRRLADLTKKHFAHEEQLMREASFAGYENHAWIHTSLLTKLGEHLTAFDAGPGKLGPDFFQFLRLWLTAHIMGIDTKYVADVSRLRSAQRRCG